MSRATESPLKKVWGVGASPPRRRVTRSQSREAQDAEEARRGGLDGEGLDVVPEGLAVSSYISPKKPGNSPQKARSRPGRQSLDWQEDPSNISGTTILQLDSEPDADLDPVLMIETLPDLERSARDLLHFLVRREPDPVRIVNTAARLGDPQSTQGVRFKRKRSNLMNQMRYFGNQTYIDVNLVNRSILPILQGKVTVDAEGWRPDPILHRANCARLALEVLVGGFGNSPKDTIRGLEGKFPAPFMEGQLDASHERATFDLALEIRTQILVGELEAHQHDDDFDPFAILDAVFYDEAMPDEAESDEADQRRLRGFSFGPFENEDGCLQERFKGAVYDRINDIRLALADDEDGSPCVEALRGAYRWRRFKLRVAEWVRSRDDAIAQQLEGQRDTEGMVNELLNEPELGTDRGGTAGSPFSGRGLTERTRTPPAQARQSSTAITPVRARESASQANKPTASSDRTTAATAETTGNHRKSGKSPFLNASAMRRMAERLAAEGHESEGHRRQTFPAPERQSAAGQEIPTSRKSPARDPRRQTLAALPHSRREPERSLQGSPAQSRHRQALTTSPGSRRKGIPERSVIQPSPEASPVLPGADDELFVDEFPLERSTRSGAGATPGERRQVGSQASATSAQRSRTPSAESIWKASQQAMDRASLSGPSGTAPTATPAEARRRQAFIDRQHDAHRVSPISQDDVRSAERVRPLQPTKRTRDVFEDIDDDDEYTQDNRVVDIASRRAQKPDQSPDKRRRVEQNAHNQRAFEESIRPFDTSRQPSQQPQPAHEPISLPEPLPELPGQDSPRKLRRRWTEDEDKLLIRYIAKYGCQWAKIKAADNSHSQASGGNKFKDRDQKQLKDRARNMKIKFMRAGEPLPANFDKVTPVNKK